MIDTLINIGLIVLGFGILIFFHELGHFLAAKWAGIRAEAFAIGMGPVIMSYRRGIGVRAGSTSRDVEKRVNEYYESKGIDPASAKTDDEHRRFVYNAMEALGIGETEYSLRWLPVGGFVKMLGQEDANPQATSSLRGSYQNTPVGKRMIVVSAGVIANLILAVVLFVWAFMVGVPMEAPMIGDTVADSPAARAVADEAAQYGITEPGLMPGDVVRVIDGDDTEVFTDLAIAAAMGRPDEKINIVIARDIGGEERELTFRMAPEYDERTRLLSLGILPASSTQLVEDDLDGILDRTLEDSGLHAAGVRKGMTLVRAESEHVRTFQQFGRVVDQSGGRDVATEWALIDTAGEQVGAAVSATVPVQPELQVVTSEYDGDRIIEEALIGFSPLTRITLVDPESPNVGVLEAGDLVLRIGEIDAPRRNEFRAFVEDSAGETIAAVILRGGERKEVTLEVTRQGRIGVGIEAARDTLLIARPVVEYTERDDPDRPITRTPSPLAGRDVAPLSIVRAVGGRDVSDWRAFRDVLLDETRSALENETGATVAVTLLSPGEREEISRVDVEISKEELADLHALGWTSELSPVFFEPVMTELSAGGNPAVAIGMGFERTYKFVINTYLTIDRLLRGTVGVEQLRGPVGIVHLGTQIADRGLMYLIFFLAMISVNLAVINFLPLPIVDGGLFLFLIYEKIKGRPPSVAFQNWATIAGLAMIVTLFLVVTYNDVTRLIFGGM